MAQHSNYAKDRDLMMEAYGSVQGIVPKTASTALPRGYVLTEGHCSDEESSESVELGGKLYEVGSPDPSEEGGIVISIEKHPNGYMISAGVYSSPEDFVNAPDSATEGYGYALTLEGQPMDEDDLEDGLGHEDNEQQEGATNEFPDGEGMYEVASVGGMHGQSIMRGKKFNSLADACAHAGCDLSEITSEKDGWIDMEGDGTTLEFMVDEDTAIVMHKNVPAEDGSCASH